MKPTERSGMPLACGVARYPLHPAAVATLSAAMRRFGQNERSVFGFLQSLEPAGLQRFAHETDYSADHWYSLADVFDHIGAASGSRPYGDRARRWSLAMDALTSATDRGHDTNPKIAVLT
jgi:hypothetical protein